MAAKLQSKDKEPKEHRAYVSPRFQALRDAEDVVSGRSPPHVSHSYAFTRLRTSTYRPPWQDVLRRWEYLPLSSKKGPSASHLNSQLLEPAMFGHSNLIPPTKYLPLQCDLMTGDLPPLRTRKSPLLRFFSTPPKLHDRVLRKV
eukprot:Sspe_Gene.114998::Locus_101548_Transcript_1_1_Confidence_1.000_Length_465::g.114998::m.114998